MRLGRMQARLALALPVSIASLIVLSQATARILGGPGAAGREGEDDYVVRWPNQPRNYAVWHRSNTLGVSKEAPERLA